MTRTSVPALVRFIPQRPPHGDCGVSALATLAACSYEEALAAIVRYQPAVLQSGLDWIGMRKAAHRLGLVTHVLRPRRYNLHEATGILRLMDANKDEHFVFLWAGRIVDKGDEGWEDPDDYLRHYGYEAKGLLVATED